jgi:hypothetical protein
VHPGGIKTNIVRHGRIRESVAEGGDPEQMAQLFENAVRTTPERAAEIITNGIVKRKPRVLIGPDAVMLDLLIRLLPVRYQKVMGLLNKLMFRDPQTEAAEAGNVASAVNHLTPDATAADAVST